MKRSVLVVFSIIMLGSLLLMPTALVNAYEDGYDVNHYHLTDAVVLDGAWSTGTWTYDSEWDDADVPTNLSSTFNWREKWDIGPPLLSYIIADFFIDDTNDAGDYFQICFDLDADGGSAPQPNDFRIDYVGHSASGFKLYSGTGSGWVENATFATWPDNIEIVDSIASSPLNSTPHWIIECKIDRDLFDTSSVGYQPGVRLAAYDANTSTLVSWPPTSQDVPEDWGHEFGIYATFPEALTIVAVVLLSCVAVAVSFYFLRRHPKAESYSAEKTGEIN